ncbi:threonine--tRNA ligase [Patescibacteria group bacterium]
MQQDKIDTIRHSVAHILAAAVTELYPKVKLGVGPVVENGFYYDLDLKTAITEDDLERIEKKMIEIIDRNDNFEREELALDEAIEFFKKNNQDYKVELLKDLKEKGTTSAKGGSASGGKISTEEQQDVGDKPNKASLYHTGEFVDLCRGPHVKSSKEIGVFKLTKVSGAYWRGDEKNPQMQRVYGVAFATQSELDKYLTMLEEAKKRDHRKLGQELDLFAGSDLVGPGLPLFTAKGTTVRRLLEDFVWALMQPYGYERVWIPHLAKSDLYKTSGHWDKFSDDIFHVSSQKTKTEFVLKPMNCPHHTQIYAARPRSYRDLPIRMSEVTTVYRDENTGQLAGLSRVRSITQDDAHIFCTMDQVKDEAKGIYEIVTKFYEAFGMPLKVRLSKHDPDHPEKYLGTAEVWKKSEKTLQDLLKGLKIKYEDGIGEAAFYGPKIDFMAEDAIGREWQLATIQLDFNLPERFELEYVDEKGDKVRPVMIHRAISGSLERFMAVLIEHYAGAFPLWLAPTQVRLVAVSKDFNDQVHGLAQDLKKSGVRVEVDDSDEKVGKKIRNAAMMKVPWTIVIGEKEAKGGDYSVNVFGQEENLDIEHEQLIDKIKEMSQMPV